MGRAFNVYDRVLLEENEENKICTIREIKEQEAIVLVNDGKKEYQKVVNLNNLKKLKGNT